MTEQSTFTEIKRSKIIINRTSSSNSYKLIIPKRWAEEGLGLSPDNKDIKISYTEEKIIIEKF